MTPEHQAVAGHVVAFLVLAPALADPLFFGSLRRHANSATRIRAYASIIIWEWAAAIAAFCVYGPTIIHPTPLSASDQHCVPAPWILFTVVLLLAAELVREDLMPTGKPKPQRANEHKSGAAKVKFLLPNTAKERAWWAAVAITSGICEEFMYRGFFLRYLHLNPWHLGLAVALICSSLLFGLGHVYQGVSFGIKAAVSGALFFLLFIATGTLLWPILVHVFIDLSPVVILVLSKRR